MRGCTRCWWALALGCVLGAWPSAAWPSAGFAQRSDRVTLRIELADPSWLDVEAVRSRLGALSEVTLDEDLPLEASAALLVVRMEAPDRAWVALTEPDGRVLERSVELQDDPEERAHTVAILAANLLEDESRELLDLLRGSSGEVSAGDPDADAASADDAAAADADDAELDAAELDAASTEAASAVEVSSGDVSSGDVSSGDVSAEGATSNAGAGLSVVRFGAAGHLGSVAVGSGSELDLLYGFELAWTPEELVALGIREVNVQGIPRGDGIQAGLAPFIELAWTESFFSLYGQLGAQVQVAFEFTTGTQWAGVAPLVVAGARFRLAPIVSIGIETALRLVVTDRFVTALHALPQFAVPWTGGLSLLFHL